MAKFPGKLMRASGVALLLFVSCTKAEVRSPGGWTDERSLADARLNVFLDGARFAEALNMADSLIASGARDSRVLAQRARALAGLGRSADAIATFEDALLGDYENCENHVQFANYLMRLGKTGRAQTEFMEAKRFCEGRYVALIYRNLAVAGIKLNKPDLARQYVDEGLLSSPGDPYLSGLKGMLIARDNPVEAESLFATAQSGAEASSDFLVQYGILLINASRPLEAVEVLEKASRMEPEDRDIRICLAEALYRAQSYEEAEKALRALLAEKDEAEIRGSLARVLYHEKRYEESLDICLTLEQSPEVMDRIAMCLQGLGKSDEAVAWERKTLAAKPDWPQAMMNMAVILAARGELDGAAALLERVLAIEPDNVVARSNLARLKEALEGLQNEK
ncbi:MAG: tetratricopeptide repeat protein [Candidatus Krumholzibacteria bacterium]|nr:tetratricopeptide repeat protein [Candidatus Krumholzibacteria bacterium]